MPSAAAASCLRCALTRWRAVCRAGASETKALCANCGRVTVVIEHCLSTWVYVTRRVRLVRGEGRDLSG